MMKKARILFLATLSPPVHGSSVVSQQIKESQLINNSFECDYVNLATSRKMNERRVAFVKLWRFIYSYLKLFWKLLTKKYDLCYISLTCHGVGFIKDAPFALLCRLFGKKLVIHQHNKGLSKDVNRWPYRWLMPMVYKDAKVILLSWRLYPDIEKVVPRGNVLICPNGIKLADTFFEKKKGNKIPHLLFLSNLIESKGVIVLLDALKILADKGYSFRCDFVGGETKEIDAKRFAYEVEKRRLGSSVFYRGRKYGPEKDNVMAQSDVFVFPSFEDCFPLVLLEAMSHRLPIVTTTEGAIPDEVSDGVNGLICERADFHSLANCLEELLTNPDMRKALGDEGYKILKEKFTTERFEENLEKAFLECLKE